MYLHGWKLRDPGEAGGDTRGPGSVGHIEKPGFSGKAGAADSNDEGSLLPAGSHGKARLTAKRSPITVKALLVGNTSKPGLGRDPQETCSNVSDSKCC